MLHFGCDTVLLHVGKKTQKLNLCPASYYSHHVLYLKQDFGCYLKCHYFRSIFCLNHCCTVLPWKCLLFPLWRVNLWSGFQCQFPRCFVSPPPHPHPPGPKELQSDPVLSVWPGFVLPVHVTQFGLPVWPSFVLPEWISELLCKHETQFCLGSLVCQCDPVLFYQNGWFGTALQACDPDLFCKCVPHFCPVRVCVSLLSCELDTGTRESIGKLLNIKPEHMSQFWHANRTQVLQKHTHAKRKLLREPECIP